MSKRLRKGLRAAIYSRTSDKKPKNSDALDNQDRMARRAAKELGMTIVESCVYRLNGVSGGKLRGHPIMERLLDDAERALFDVVMIANVERFARDTKHALESEEFLWSHGVILYGVNEEIDTSTPKGRRDFAEKAAQAQYGREHSNKVSRDAMRGRLQSAQEGTYTKQFGGIPPFGYELRDGKFVPHLVEAPIRVEMYHRFLACGNLTAVAEWLNSLGMRTRKGKRFRDTSVEDLLQDPIAKGLRRLNYTQGIPGKNKWVHKPLRDQVTVACDPIIDEALWQACQELLASLGTGRPGLTLGTGKVFCQPCDPEGPGRKLYARGCEKRFRCSKCKLEVTESEIDELCLTYLGRYTPEGLHITRATLDAERKRTETLIQVQSYQKASFSLKAAQLQASDPELTELMQQIRQQEIHLELLAVSLARMKRKVAALKGRSSVELHIPDLWMNLEFSEKNLLASRLISHLSLMHNGEVAVELLPPFPDGYGSLVI